MNKDVMFSSNSEEWATPQDFFDKLNEEFNFTLDAAATWENSKCENCYTKQLSGLLMPWVASGAVWCNPPYGRNIGEWVKKGMLESYEKDQTVVMLLPARTDTSWFHKYILGKAEIRFIRGRLKFGNSKNAALFPSMVVIFRNGLFSVSSMER